MLSELCGLIFIWRKQFATNVFASISNHSVYYGTGCTVKRWDEDLKIVEVMSD